MRDSSCLRCVWFELELAASYLRTGDYGRALKNFAHVEQHFADIGEDQFDFHTYCVRKMTLRESVESAPSPAGRREERLFTPAAVNRCGAGSSATAVNSVSSHLQL